MTTEAKGRDNRVLLLILGLPFLLLFGLGAFVTRPVPRVVTMKVTGPPGAEVKATCEADGETREFGEKVVPAEIAVTAHTLSFEVRRTDGGQKPITVTVHVDGVGDILSATAREGIHGAVIGPSYFNFGVGRSSIAGMPPAAPEENR